MNNLASTVLDARQRVEAARVALQEALAHQRTVNGESELETCPGCQGKGSVPDFRALLGEKNAEESREPCSTCQGSGQTKKVYPLIVTAIQYDLPSIPLRPALFNAETTWVSVRPCAEEHQGKTYLGYLLGDLVLGVHLRYSEEGVLKVGPGPGNPAIFVPELGKVILGCASFWRAIKTPEELKQITNQDIDNVWYIKALKELNAAAASAPEAQADGET